MKNYGLEELRALEFEGARFRDEGDSRGGSGEARDDHSLIVQIQANFTFILPTLDHCPYESRVLLNDGNKRKGFLQHNLHNFKINALDTNSIL